MSDLGQHVRALSDMAAPQQVQHSFLDDRIADLLSVTEALEGTEINKA
jgi:hypothetical protein